MNELDYQKLNTRCEKAIQEIDKQELGRWINLSGPLYKSISIQPEGLPSIANAHFEGDHYEFISQLHKLYLQLEEKFVVEKSHYEIIVHFIQQMNIQKLNHYLDDIKYQNKSKFEFLDSLADAFVRMREKRNFYLYANSGKCKACNFGKAGFEFVGNVDGSYFDLIFKEVNNRVSDIFECNFFECASPEANVVKKRIVFK